mmetsp:Transcript_8017/g.22044  ORF Transcript_8017/g.22044 Transcript_8017/m.22044 type:complete len:279 (-) Transcript_8017:131-967(-)
MSTPWGARRLVNASRAGGCSAMFLMAAMTERCVKAGVLACRRSHTGLTALDAACSLPSLAMVMAMMQPTARRSSSPSSPCAESTCGGCARRCAMDATRSTWMTERLPSWVLARLKTHCRHPRTTSASESSAPRCITRWRRATTSVSSATSMPMSRRMRLLRARREASSVSTSSTSRDSTKGVTTASSASIAQPSREELMALRARADAVRTLDDWSLRWAVMDGTMSCSWMAMRPCMTMARLARQSADKRRTGSVSEWMSLFSRCGMDGVADSAAHFSS